MVKNHLKRLASPKTWKIERKKTKFVARPSPGPHSREFAVTIKLALTEMLNIANNSKEVQVILNNKDLTVDNIVRSSLHFPVGLFDVISFQKTKKSYRITMNKNGNLVINEVPESESKIKPCKITGKTSIGKKIQLNLNDGKNILTTEKKYNVGDTIMVSLPELTIKEHLPLTKNMTMMLTSGKNAGKIGKIEDIREKNLIYKDSENKTHETLKKYAFVLGKDKPLIKLEK